MERSFFSYVWRHSRREQWFVLALVVLSLPFYWASLDIPRLIVNDAIQGRAFNGGVAEVRGLAFSLNLPAFLGGAQVQISEGYLFSQLQYLLMLSIVFLALTLVNGGFKYAINLRKGILGERILRRLRFELFELVMRFRPEDLRETRSAEIASMIKDEVEPIGGFFGEAFITPAFLSTQALTALAFIIAQNLVMGLLTAAIIGVQSLIIPRLRREQLRLGRERQLASRKLAGRVAEMVDAAPMLHGFGLVPRHGAEIGDRLGHLFRIRVDLFRRKFSVKFLNNLLAQVTPFLFYTLGGYLALTGQMDIGQLVAVIAAYRDLPTPVKELIDWDQQRADVTVKFEQVVKAFSRDLLPAASIGEDEAPLPAGSEIRLHGLRHFDRRGIVQLEPLTLSFTCPTHLALVGHASSGQSILPKILGRQITEYSGLITIAGRDILTVPDDVFSRFLLYLDRETYVMTGTIRDNLGIVIERKSAELSAIESLDRAAALARIEAIRTGNPLHSATEDWVDYQHLGHGGPDAVEAAIEDALRVVGAYRSVYSAGLSGPIGVVEDADTRQRLLEARAALRADIEARTDAVRVEAFDSRRYALSATVGENLLFGHPVGPRFAAENIAGDLFLRAILDAESLTEPLVRFGTRIAQTVLDILPGAQPGAPALARYDFVPMSDPDMLRRLLSDAVGRRRSIARPAARQALLGFALNYIEPRHRLGLVTEDFRGRVLRARRSFRSHLAATALKDIEFFDPNALMANMPVRENLLFGRISNGDEAVEARIEAMIEAYGLASFVLRHGLSRQAGPGGRLLTPEQRSKIALTRAVLAKPEILVLDGALAALAPAEQSAILNRLRLEFAGRSLIVNFTDREAAASFDRTLIFDGPRLAGDLSADDNRNVGPEISAPATAQQG